MISGSGPPPAGTPVPAVLRRLAGNGVDADPARTEYYRRLWAAT